ncbi:MAG: HisA/HisF-related TIM barrel protein [Candidatus Thorarchaeota archaeon]
MKNFKIVPVIDLLNSNVVHAKKGERKKYKPLKSHLFQTSNPIEIINRIKQEFDLYEFYIADLDSILYREVNFRIIKEILKIPEIEIILDPGIINIKEIIQFIELKIKGLILGLETIKNLEVISKALSILNPDNIILSIDMYKGKILSKVKEIINKNPLELIQKINARGVKKIILLDLYRVGQRVGGIPPIYIDILHDFDGEVLVGGGIRDYEDLLAYKKQNFSGVLIATALYDGTISSEQLSNFQK